MKKILRKITPPIIADIIKNLTGKGAPEYRGNFKTWKNAVEHSSGYNDPAIFEKVKNARLTVLRGEKAYERDSVLFDSIQYFWPVAASLLLIGSRENNSL